MMMHIVSTSKCPDFSFFHASAFFFIWRHFSIVWILICASLIVRSKALRIWIKTHSCHPLSSFNAGCAIIHAWALRASLRTHLASLLFHIKELLWFAGHRLALFFLLFKEESWHTVRTLKPILALQTSSTSLWTLEAMGQSIHSLAREEAFLAAQAFILFSAFWTILLAVHARESLSVKELALSTVRNTHSCIWSMHRHKCNILAINTLVACFSWIAHCTPGSTVIAKWLNSVVY